MNYKKKEILSEQEHILLKIMPRAAKAIIKEDIKLLKELAKY